MSQTGAYRLSCESLANALVRALDDAERAKISVRYERASKRLSTAAISRVALNLGVIPEMKNLSSARSAP